MITVKDGDVDIGANPSAEEEAEQMEETVETVNNVVYVLDMLFITLNIIYKGIYHASTKHN